MDKPTTTTMQQFLKLTWTSPCVDMDKLRCFLRDQSIPDYGNEAAQRAVL